MDIINDDEFNAVIDSLEDTDPNRDIRPLVIEWIKRVMPDQLFRFDDSYGKSIEQKRGLLSPVHGYDPKTFSKGGTTGTGGADNAYGRY